MTHSLSHAVALAHPLEPFALAGDSFSQAAKALGYAMYGTKERANVTLIFAVAMLGLGQYMNHGAQMLAQCGL